MTIRSAAAPLALAVKVNVIAVKWIGTWAQHGMERPASLRADGAQKALVLRAAVIARQHHHFAAIGQREGGYVDGIPLTMFRAVSYTHLTLPTNREV